LDANKPEALDDRPQNEQVLAEWFSPFAQNPPEIIVVGFQELVDLESVSFL
jgi:hypothetical protein